MRNAAAYLAIGLSALLGGGSLVAYTVFLYAGPFHLVDLNMGHPGRLWLDAGLSLLFFMQHSGMVRKPFRRRLGRFVPKDFDAAVYSTASGVILVVLLVLWQEGDTLITATAPMLRWAFRTVFFLSLLGFMWGGMSLRAFDPLGIRPLLARLRGGIQEQMPFTVRGAYRLVRHPLYLFSILMIWSSPDLTTDRLLFNVLWTVWIVIGAFLEERDLEAEFGASYREYRQTVPMFIPFFRGKRWRESSSS